MLHSASQVREHNNDGWPVLTKLLPLLNSGTVNFFGDNAWTLHLPQCQLCDPLGFGSSPSA